MTILEIWLIAISLAIDYFSVSVTSGAILKKIRWKTFLTMAVFFGFFQSLMSLIGWFGASRFSDYIKAYLDRIRIASPRGRQDDQRKLPPEGSASDQSVLLKDHHSLSHRHKHRCNGRRDHFRLYERFLPDPSAAFNSCSFICFAPPFLQFFYSKDRRAHV